MKKKNDNELDLHAFSHRAAKDKPRNFIAAVLSAPFVPALYIAEKIVEKRVKAERVVRKSERAAVKAKGVENANQRKIAPQP